jgi:hypothetical protein
VKKHNSLTDAKVALRRAMLPLLPEPPRVLDVFAGPGVLWELAYGSPREWYLGIDSDRSVLTRGREMRFGQAVEVLRELDLGRFNVFDLDAFSNPWRELEVVLQRAPRRQHLVFLTESLGRNLGAGKRPDEVDGLVAPSGRRLAFKHNRTGIFRHVLYAKLTAAGYRASRIDLYEKRRQPRTIYAGALIAPIEH